jgi:hypothetical protein
MSAAQLLPKKPIDDLIVYTWSIGPKAAQRFFGQSHAKTKK